MDMTESLSDSPSNCFRSPFVPGSLMPPLVLTYAFTGAIARDGSAGVQRK